jgi:hypothetical protein
MGYGCIEKIVFFFESQHSSSLDLSLRTLHVKFGPPRSVLTLSVCFSHPLCTDASGGLRWICLNHLKWYWTSFLAIGATPTLSGILSFRTWSLLVWPHIYLNMHISATLSTIQYCVSNNRSIELPFKLLWHFLITNNARSLAPLHPLGFDSMVHIFINVHILL